MDALRKLTWWTEPNVSWFADLRVGDPVGVVKVEGGYKDGIFVDALTDDGGVILSDGFTYSPDGVFDKNTYVSYYAIAPRVECIAEYRARQLRNTVVNFNLRDFGEDDLRAVLGLLENIAAQKDKQAA